jgi:hypothetical protein
LKRITVRIEAIELRVLGELCKDGRKVSDIVRKALSQYLHANHEPIYQSIYETNRRRNEELLKSYYARQAQEQKNRQTNTENKDSP